MMGALSRLVAQILVVCQQRNITIDVLECNIYSGQEMGNTLAP